MKLFVGQAEHELWPVDAVVVPMAHAVQEVCPVDGWCVPLAQGLHVEAEVAPVAVEDDPAGHCLHPWPATSAYVPAGQVVHDVEPGVEPVPVGQATHCASEAEYVAALCVLAGQF